MTIFIQLFFDRKRNNSSSVSATINNWHGGGGKKKLLQRITIIIIRTISFSNGLTVLRVRSTIAISIAPTYSIAFFIGIVSD